MPDYTHSLPEPNDLVSYLLILRKVLLKKNSTKCSHTYSKAAIYDLIDSARKQRRSAKCPVTGCSVTIEKSDLKVSVQHNYAL